MNILPDTIEAGTSHNLDLSLGISPSSKRLKNNDYSGGYSFGCMTCKIPEERGPMVLLFTFLLVAIFFYGWIFSCIGASLIYIICCLIFCSIEFQIQLLNLNILIKYIKCFAN